MIYTGNPTAGGTDGVAVSENGVFSSPITGQVASDGETVITCAARAPEGETGSISLSAAHIESGEYVSGGDGRLFLSTDGNSWSSGIKLNITDVNTLFYIMLAGNDDSAGTYSDLALETWGGTA